MARGVGASFGRILFPLWAGMVVMRAEEPLRYGLQLGLAVPSSNDLRVTTGAGLNPTLGAHGEWRFNQKHALRVRIDLQGFNRGEQVSDSPGVHQEIGTKVRNKSLGGEYLQQLPFDGQRWSLGAGLHLVRWTVASTSRIEQPGGAFAFSSTSSWTRQGQSLFGSYRWDKRTELELRLMSSHYGYQNQPARTLSLNLLWHF